MSVEKLDLWNLQKYTCGSGNLAIELLGGLKSLRILILNLVSFEEFTADNVLMLLEVCPSDVHVYLDTFAVDSSTFADYIHVIGTCLRRMSLEYEYWAFPRDVLPAFDNIEKLALYASYNVSNLVESIFDQPMRNLRNLSIRYMDDLKIWTVITRSLTTLREFSCHFSSEFDENQGYIPVKGPDFTELLQANKYLRSIALDFGQFRDPQPLTKKVADFIPRFKVCHSLKFVALMYRKYSLDYTRHEEISNACVALRTKSLTLFVNEIRYLPS